MPVGGPQTHREPVGGPLCASSAMFGVPQRTSARPTPECGRCWEPACLLRMCSLKHQLHHPLWLHRCSAEQLRWVILECAVGHGRWHCVQLGWEWGEAQRASKATQHTDRGAGTFNALNQRASYTRTPPVKNAVRMLSWVAASSCTPSRL